MRIVVKIRRVERTRLHAQSDRSLREGSNGSGSRISRIPLRTMRATQRPRDVSLGDVLRITRYIQRRNKLHVPAPPLGTIRERSSPTPSPLASSPPPPLPPAMPSDPFVYLSARGAKSGTSSPRLSDNWPVLLRARRDAARRRYLIFCPWLRSNNDGLPCHLSRAHGGSPLAAHVQLLKHRGDNRISRTAPPWKITYDPGARIAQASLASRSAQFMR